MKLLCIEMATRSLSVALFVEGKLVQEIEPSDQKKSHSEKLMPSVVSLLENQNLKLDEIDGIAFSNGPGSFTSLRVGFATIQGLGLGRNFQYYPVSSLEALAFGSHIKGTLVCLMHAGRGRYHIRVFNSDEKTFQKDASIVSPIGEQALKDYLLSLKGATLIGPKVNEHESIELSKYQVEPKASFLGEFVFKQNITPVSFEALKLDYAMDADIG